jgi:hypothetical protein
MQEESDDSTEKHDRIVKIGKVAAAWSPVVLEFAEDALLLGACQGGGGGTE